MLKAQSGLTIRAVLLGLCLVAIICLGSPYSLWIVGSTEPTWSYFPVAVGCPFVVLVLVNALLRYKYKSLALAPAELVIILIMGLVVTGIPVFIVGTWIALIASPYYGATPENDWVGYIQPYLPNWAIPWTAGEEIRWFWEGLPSGHTMPINFWIGPLAWWLSLILTVYFVCFCLVVILRRQWVDQERLTFPLTEMPRLLIDDSKDGILQRWTPAFWIGFGLSLLLVLLNIFDFFYPNTFNVAIWSGTRFQFGKDFPYIELRLIPPILGFMFLAGTSISFSIWFFYLLAVLQEGITNRIGYEVSAPDAFVWGMQSISWQGWGAFAAMVLWSFWVGRGHLKAVCRQVFMGRKELDDSQEMLSYRVAVYGMLIGLVYILFWLVMAGLDLYVALLFTLGAVIGYIGITRLVVQTGMYYLTTPVGGQAFTLAITGTGIGPTNLVPLSLSYAWHGDIQSVFMPAAAHGAKLDEVSRLRWRMGGVMALAVVVGFVITLWYVFYLCYEYGAGNLRSWYFNAGGGIGGMSFSGVIRQFNNPESTDWNKLMYSGIGASIYSVLSLCQYRLHWWPLHPVGLVVAPLWMTRLTAFSVFFAWLAKSAVLRYGGIAGYRAVRPFFIGIIGGFFVGVGISFVVDVLWFKGIGHGVPW